MNVSEDKIRKFCITVSYIGVFLLVLVLRGNSILTPFERDEGEYAYSARLLLNGGLPYTETFLQKPPLIVYTYALGQLFDPHGVASPRILAIIFILGTIYLVGYIAHKEFGWVAGISSMWIVTPMLSFPYLAALAANTETFMLLPLTATVALFVTSKSERHRVHRLHMLAGFFATTAILYKPIAIFPLAFLFILWSVRIQSKESSVKALMQVVLFWSIGCIISLVTFLGYFLIRGAGPALWESTVVFNRYYASFFGLGFGYLIQRFTLFFFKWTPLIIVLLWSLVVQLKKKTMLHLLLSNDF
jgi:hypothetical protein